MALIVPSGRAGRRIGAFFSGVNGVFYMINILAEISLMGDYLTISNISQRTRIEHIHTHKIGSIGL